MIKFILDAMYYQIFIFNRDKHYCPVKVPDDYYKV